MFEHAAGTGAVAEVLRPVFFGRERKTDRLARGLNHGLTEAPVERKAGQMEDVSGRDRALGTLRRGEIDFGLLFQALRRLVNQGTGRESFTVERQGRADAIGAGPVGVARPEGEDAVAGVALDLGVTVAPEQ